MDRLVGAWDELYESVVSQALMYMYCFKNASLEKSCLVIDLVCFVSPQATHFCFPECHQNKVFFIQFPHSKTCTQQLVGTAK